MKFTTLALGAVSVFSSFVAAGDFFATCDPEWYVEKNSAWMHASCRSRSGALIKSRLDLNLCIGNDDGSLVPQRNGRFYGSCSDCAPNPDTERLPADLELPPGITIPGLWVSSSTLQCNCRRKDGSYNLGKQLDLNRIIDNDNGILSCYDVPGYRE